MDRDDELVELLAFGSAPVNAGKLISGSMIGSLYFNMEVTSRCGSGRSVSSCPGERENNRHVTCADLPA